MTQGHLRRQHRSIASLGAAVSERQVGMQRTDDLARSKIALCTGNTAVLVSGQLHRFYWEDFLAPSDTFPCPLDFYIVLHSHQDIAHQTYWSGTAPEKAPYNPDDIDTFKADVDDRDRFWQE